MKRPRGLWTAIALLAVQVLAGCRGDQPAAPSASVLDDPGLIHVHGLGINPADGTLYTATHTGLFTVRDGTGQRVADRLRDTMGFTVVGPDHFLGSGHPDFRDPQLYDPNRRPLLGSSRAATPAAAGSRCRRWGRPTSTLSRSPTAACMAMTPPAAGSWSPVIAATGRCGPSWS